MPNKINVNVTKRLCLKTASLNMHDSVASLKETMLHKMNRQARVALGDRIRNSLQLTALRLKPSRLLGVQAPTLHYP